MPGRVRAVEGHRRMAIDEGWELASAEPGPAVPHGSTLPAAPANGWIPALVPGTVASALRARGAWGWQSTDRFDALDWWYRGRFDVATAADGSRLVLCFDGLATVADVWLNGEPLLHSENMFVAHERDVTALVRPGSNELHVCFKALDGLLAARRPRPRWRAPMVENQRLRWFRTTLLGRTPGWSPPVAAVGPWRPVWLERRAAVEVEEARLVPSVEGRDGTVELSLRIRSLGGKVHGGRFRISGESGTHETGLRAQAAGADAVWLAGHLRIPDVPLWWPHTHGPQPLHDARAVIEVGAREVTVNLGHIGFRTLALATGGSEFRLAINGVPVFWRGACWTPLDVVTLRASREDYRHALETARGAGMNMIRVGGTMVYEADDFHDICDELGILIWQDFMFASMDYPDEDPSFLASVDAETQQLLGRLQARPSTGVLCGNSESEMQAAFWGAARALWRGRLFAERLPSLCGRMCPDVPYWPSSASGGDHPNQASAGTSSYYGVGAYRRPLEDARRSEVRFASECLAFANVPGARTMAEIAPGRTVRVHDPAWKERSPRDLGAGWDFDDVRDHYVRALYGVDPTDLRGTDHERYLSIARVSTGEAMAAALAEWRRGRSACRGALVWFLRDLWPGAGWGVLDARGRPKAAFDYLRRALQPVAVFLSDEGLSGLAVHVINEGPEPLAAHLRVDLYRDRERRVGGGATSVCVPARGAIEIATAGLFDGFVDTTYAYRFGPPPVDLTVASLLSSSAPDDASTPLGQAFHFPLGLPSGQERDVGLAAHVRPSGDGHWQLRVRTRRFAQSVSIDAEGHEPADNHFHLAPESERTIALRGPASAAPPGGSVEALNAQRSVAIVAET